MSSEPRDYLIWSHEHGRWWKVPSGYTSHLNLAGRFTREAALDRCMGAMVGTANRLAALPDIPVLFADIAAMHVWYLTKFPDHLAEDWQ
jgi:hypothetical protein